MRDHRQRVAVLAAADVNAFEVATLFQAFIGANDVAGREAYEIGAAGSDRVVTSTFGVDQFGFSLAPDRSLTWAEEADTVLVPSLGGYLDPPDALLRTVARAYARGARIASVALGSYVLARAGLLDGRAATTHWNWVDDFAQRFCRIRVTGERLLVEDGSFHSSAGGASTFDLAVHLVREDQGIEIADALDHYLVMADRRDGSSRQPEVARRSLDPIEETLAWTRQHLAEDVTLKDLAERVHMSERTFTRAFQRAQGTSPVDWLLSRRIERAEVLLSDTDRTISQVAHESGFRSESALRYHFNRVKSTSPSRYREVSRRLTQRPPGAPEEGQSR